MHDVGVEKGEITADVASRLIAEQFLSAGPRRGFSYCDLPEEQ
jgi:hypothetical protein